MREYRSIKDEKEDSGMRRKIGFTGFILIVLAVTVFAVAAPGHCAAPYKDVIKIGHFGALCEAPFFVAYEKGFFKKEGLNVELLKGDDQINRDGITLGKIQVTDGVLQAWIKPLEQGLDVRFTLGIHSGCMSTIVAANSPFKSFKDLKGKRIGVSGIIGGGPMNYAYRAAFHEGLDPRRDFEWKAYPPPVLFAALERGEIDAAVTGDTLNFIPIKAGKARLISMMATDQFSKDEYCCLLVFNTAFFKEHPEVAAAVTRAVYNAAQWTHDHKDEAVRILVEKQYILGTVALNREIFSHYSYMPSVAGGEKDFRKAIREFKQVGLTSNDLDENKLVERTYVKLTGIE
jgi:NitT/TauT family transport system substrate-binding protein